MKAVIMAGGSGTRLRTVNEQFAQTDGTGSQQTDGRAHRRFAQTPWTERHHLHALLLA